MITSVVQKTKNTIYIYNERGQVSGIISNAQLQGYTSETVSAKPHSTTRTVQIYNEKGRVINTVFC